MFDFKKLVKLTVVHSSLQLLHCPSKTLYQVILPHHTHYLSHFHAAAEHSVVHENVFFFICGQGHCSLACLVIKYAVNYIYCFLNHMECY